MHTQDRTRVALLCIAASLSFLILPPSTFLAAIIFTAVALRWAARSGGAACEDERIQNILEELCKKAEQPVPKLHCTTGSQQLASARGILPKKRRLVINEKTLELPDDELRAVLAHELGHYAAWDTLDALIWLPAVLATIRSGIHAAEWTYQQLRGEVEAPLPTNFAVLATLAPLVLLLLAVLATTRRSEERADTYAIKLTNDPAALQRILRRLPEKKLPRALNAHPSPQHRIERLQPHSTPE